MPCFHPLEGFRSAIINPVTGKRSIVFDASKSSMGSLSPPIPLPCGQCVGCRLERSRQWAIRCSHEASLYSDNCFITLTFRDSDLPDDHALDVRYFQLFMKRLRKRFGEGIRFYHCGEYGETYGRPHYHACVFNFDFPDKVLWKVTNEQRLFTSKILEELWPYGFCSIGSVTFQSAAYVARYIMKKVNGDLADSHYEYIVPDTGEVVWRKPEYTTMSRRPGIGKGWYDKFHTDVYPSDSVVIKGKEMRPPRFYDTQFELCYPSDFATIKKSRIKNAKKHSADNSLDRLFVREQVQLARIKHLPRVVD